MLSIPFGLLEKFGSFLAKRQIEKVQAELAAVLARVERRYRNTDDPIDALSLLVPAADIPNLITDSIAFDDDRFYALMPSDESGWTYELSNEAQLLSDQFDVPINDADPDEQFLLQQPLHIWYCDDVFETDKYPFAILRPRISVEHISHQSMLQHLSRGVRNNAAQPEVEFDDDLIETFVDEVEEHYQRDPTGLYLGNALSGLIGLAPGRIFVLESVKRSGASLDARFTLILSDITVNGVNYDHFYVFHRTIALHTPGTLWIVTTVVPTPDRLSEHYDWITKWMSGFAIPFL